MIKHMGGEYVTYRKSSVVEVVGKTETGMIVRNVGRSDDEWEEPFAVFSTTYFPESRVANPQIEHNFSYHVPREGQPEAYIAIREKAKELAYLIDDLALDVREKSLAMTKLEEAVMWANAAIARN